MSNHVERMERYKSKGSVDIIKEKERKESFDIITSRWVAYMPKLLELAKPFLKKWWIIYLWKKASHEELDEWIRKAESLKLDIISEHIYEILDEQRSVFVFKKR